MISALDFHNLSESLAKGFLYDKLLLSLAYIQAYREVRERDVQIMKRGYKFFRNIEKGRENYFGVILGLSAKHIPKEEELKSLHAFLFNLSQLEMSLTDDILHVNLFP